MFAVSALLQMQFGVERRMSFLLVRRRYQDFSRTVNTPRSSLMTTACNGWFNSSRGGGEKDGMSVGLHILLLVISVTCKANLLKDWCTESL